MQWCRTIYYSNVP